LKANLLNNSFIFFLGILLILIISCKKNQKEPALDVGYEYYPINLGKFIVYQVDSIVFNDFTGTIDTFCYQIKEFIESDFIDNQGRKTQRIERYRRLNDTSLWNIQDVWYSNRTGSTAEKVEENIRFVKLVFPVKINQVWNGNQYNYLEPQTYSYKNLHQPYDISIMHFDSTVTVVQKEELNLILDDYIIEVYAKNTGMIYKKFRHLEKQPDGVIIKGLDLTYSVISFGIQ